MCGTRPHHSCNTMTPGVPLPGRATSPLACPASDENVTLAVLAMASPCTAYRHTSDIDHAAAWGVGSWKDPQLQVTPRDLVDCIQEGRRSQILGPGVALP